MKCGLRDPRARGPDDSGAWAHLPLGTWIRPSAKRSGCRSGGRRSTIGPTVHQLHALGLDGQPYLGRPHLRIGEAKIPGPGPTARRDNWGILSAQRPNHGGFRDACAPGFSEGSGEHEEDPPMDLYALKVATANVTSWGSAIAFLNRTEADLVLVQEHKLGQERMEAAIVWLRRRGWNAIMAPAKIGPNGGWSAGVAILAKSHLGISMPAVGSEIVCPAHAVAARIEAPGCRPFMAVSVYPQDGDGLGKTNMGMLQRIGLRIAAQGEDSPFIIGGDLQATPQQLAATGYAGQLGAVIAASADPMGTCRTPTTSREIDYFVVSTGLSAGIAAVTTVPRSGLRTHRPVRLEFKPRLTSLRALIIRKPPPMTTERIVGPLREVTGWETIAEEARMLVGKAADATQDEEGIHRRLGELYAWWADLAEEELIECTYNGHQMPKKGLRGKAPVLVWRSVLPEQPKGDDDDFAVLWRNIANSALDLQRLAAEKANAGRDIRWAPRRNAPSEDDDMGVGSSGAEM